MLELDDFLIAPPKDSERRDLLEVIEDRYDRSSTLIATQASSATTTDSHRGGPIVAEQVPTKNWHEALADPTIADPICDRLVHNAHVVALRGPSIRRKKALNNGAAEGKNSSSSRRFAPIAPRCAGTSAQVRPE